MKTVLHNFKVGLRRRLLVVLLAFIVALLGVFATMAAALFWIDRTIASRLEQLRAMRPSHIYAVFPPLSVNQSFRISEFENVLREYGYVPAGSGTCENCYRFSGDRLTLRRAEIAEPGWRWPAQSFDVIWDDNAETRSIRSVSSGGSEVNAIVHPPKRIGVFAAGRLRTQDFVPLEQVPVSLRLAVMAIEDDRFLEHRGISVRAVLRALWQDFLAGGFVQGGSTITQQLMKNLFFSRQKVMTRKFKEALYALVAEARHPKEKILEAYLNEIYLGQISHHEIHGANEAARFYYNRAITNLTLSQSATLAAIIQAPNALDPRRNPEKVRQRRDLVLRRMLDAGFIVPEEYQQAMQEPLGTASEGNYLEDIDYVLELAFSELPASVQSSIDTSAHAVYLNVRPRLQEIASRVLRDHLHILEKRLAGSKRIMLGAPLEGVLLAVDVPSCRILASQGGRNYRLSPFNRVLRGRRQAGSLIKPFVYLSGLLGEPFITPDTLLEDAPFQWSYDRQVWQPKNYDEKFRGNVTVAEALEQSLNIPTARLAQLVGIPRLIETLQQAGIQSNLYAVPSLSLGSADLTPLELARAYLTLARTGNQCMPQSVDSVYDENGNQLYKSRPQESQAFPREPVLTLLEMMKAVIQSGTAKAAGARLGVDSFAFAGKTGTTSDYRDAWFIGFSPDLLALTWVGYDEKESVGLTGAGAALPIWMEFIQAAKRDFLVRDF